MECLEEFVEHMHTRDDVGIGTSVDLWRLRIQRMRPTVDVNMRSGHCLVSSVTFVLFEWESLATSMESHGEVWWKRGSFHGVPWTAQFWMRGWSSDRTAGNGCSGMHVPSVSRQLAADAVVCTVSQCHDSWYWKALDSRSSEVSVLISGRLRRMVIEVFGKHSGEYHEFQFCLLSRLVLHR